MAQVSEAAVADTVAAWSRHKKNFPQGWAYPNGVLKDAVEAHLLQIIDSHFHGQVSTVTLDSAVVLKIGADAEAEKKQQRQQALLTEIATAIEANYPDIKHSQANFDRVVTLVTSGLGVDAVIADLNWHCDEWEWSGGVKTVDLVTLLHKYPVSQLEGIYGVERVAKAFAQVQKSVHKHAQQARPSWKVDPGDKQKADAAAEMRKREADPKAIERATASCNDLVTRLNVSTNHSENARAKAQLAQIVVKVDGVFDPHRTLEARQQWIRDYKPEAERRR